MAAKAKTVTAEKTIEIPEIRKQRIRVELIGESPLITNRFTEKAQADIADKQGGKAKTKKPPRVPEEEFRSAIHVISDGKNPRYGIRAISIKKSMATAGMRFADQSKVGIFGMVMVHGNEKGIVEILGPEPQMGEDMVVFKNGTTSIAYRPYFSPWRVEVDIEFMANFISLEQIINLLNLAGMTVGIGSWRVEKGGDKGTFRVGKVKVIQ